MTDLLAERDQLHDERERMAPHGAMATDGDDKKIKSLDEEIADDPYVKEGVTILEEMLGSS